MERDNYFKWNFTPATMADWLEKAQSDLKGVHPNTLVSFTTDGIAIQPYLTQEQRNGSPHPITKREAGWVVSETVPMQEVRKANHKALELLNAGASGLTLQVDQHTDFDLLLKEILIEHITLHFQVLDGAGAKVAANLAAHIASRGLDIKTLSGSLQMDVIGNLSATGNWYHANSQNDWAAFKALVAAEDLGGYTKFFVSGAGYHNAGASAAFELGAVLAHAHEYLAMFGAQAARMHVNFAIGSNFFEEIAKLRAFKLLWRFLMEQYGFETDGLYLSAQNSVRNKTIYDPYVNMLRTSSEAMSAILGGCDDLELLPYDFAFRQPSNFSRRIARNQQLLLQFESHFDKVQDPGAGSYHLEALTEALAKEAWAAFQTIESKEGLVQTLESGWLQNEIRSQSAISQTAFDNGQLILVGANKFEKKDEQMSEKVTEPTVQPELGFTVVRPLLAQRLASKLEQEKLKLEKA
jgi:methylmalonyl-CoA mutase